MNILYKPNGTPMQVNDDSLEHALDLGWSEEKPKKEEPKKEKPTKKAK